MQLTFLQAAVPLTKKFTKRSDGRYDKTSYPLVSKVTSHTEEVSDVSILAAVLRKHAEAGNCLHTGSLNKELHEESRRGCHDKDERREWIVLDLDGLDYPNIEAFIQELPDAFHDVSYVAQHSPSSGIKPGIRMHLFFLMDREEEMKVVSDWIKFTNLVTKSLCDQITLTASDMGLSFPLDVVANANGRVIYITAPECVGFADPITERIEIVNKQHELLRYSFVSLSPSDLKREYRKKVDSIREYKGLPKRRAKEYYEARQGEDVLRKSLTEQGKVHDVEPDSDLIMRCNINGGDSHAYFYYIKYPQIIRNHKGEPQLFMKALDPVFYDKVALPAAKALHEKDLQPFVFRNINDDKYYVGLRFGHEIHQQPKPIGSDKKIEDYFVQHNGMGVPDPIETWEMRFDPTLEDQWNPVDHIFNSWRRSEIMRNAMYRSQPPTVIMKIIDHVVGNDEEAYDHFINWLAYVYQTRKKAQTAWIFHGVQGTGKGLLVDHVLSPIFGFDYVAKQQTKGLKDAFNIWMEHAVIVNIDEFDLADTGAEANGIMQNLKMWITDKFVAIRGMHQAARKAENYSNFILTTNSRSSLPVDEGDRRINFGARQEKRLDISEDEIEAIPSELDHFAGYLRGFKSNTHQAHTCLENAAKQIARELGKTSIEEFVDAVRDGDLQFFIDGAEQETDTPGLKGEYRKLLNSWIDNAKHNRETGVLAKEMQLAYRMLCNEDRKTKLGKFLKIMGHKAAPIGRPRVDGKQIRGWKIDWEIGESTLVNIGGHIMSVESKLEDELRASLASPEERQ